MIHIPAQREPYHHRQPEDKLDNFRGSISWPKVPLSILASEPAKPTDVTADADALAGHLTRLDEALAKFTSTAVRGKIL